MYATPGATNTRTHGCPVRRTTNRANSAPAARTNHGKTARFRRASRQPRKKQTPPAPSAPQTPMNTQNSGPGPGRFTTRLVAETISASPGEHRGYPRVRSPDPGACLTAILAVGLGKYKGVVCVQGARAGGRSTAAQGVGGVSPPPIRHGSGKPAARRLGPGVGDEARRLRVRFQQPGPPVPEVFQQGPVVLGPHFPRPHHARAVDVRLVV